VQSALNICQNDLAEQLTNYKQVVTEKMQNIEIGLGRQIERKADFRELKSAIESKAEISQVVDRCVLKDDFLEVKESLAALQEAVPAKADIAFLQRLEQNCEVRFEELTRAASKKSNIKDVCALLDMKSSKYISLLTAV
jgi:Tfp pilus assembly protein PilO